MSYAILRIVVNFIQELDKNNKFVCDKSFVTFALEIKCKIDRVLFM